MTVIQAVVNRLNQRHHRGNGLHLFLNELLHNYGYVVTERMDVFRVYRNNQFICRVWFDRNADRYQVAA